MSEQRFEVLFYGDVINCVRDENGKEYNLHETITILNEQQATISALKEENKQLRRLFEEMKQPITINLTEEDEKELRKLLGLIDDE